MAHRLLKQRHLNYWYLKYPKFLIINSDSLSDVWISTRSEDGGEELYYTYFPENGLLTVTGKERVAVPTVCS